MSRSPSPRWRALLGDLLAGGAARFDQGPLERSLGPWFLFGGLFLTHLVLTLVYELEPASSSHAAEPFFWDDPQRDSLFLGCLLAGTLGLAVYPWLRQSTLGSKLAVQRILNLVLALLVFVAGLSYFYGSNGSRSVYPHVHDQVHYVLGPKYFAELGYDRLYVCAAQALGPEQVPDKTPVRDLASDQSRNAGALRNSIDCRAHFSDARWATFQHDVQVFYEASPRILRKALGDRGYNGTPFHSFVAGKLLNLVSLDYRVLSLLPLLDTLSLCLMLVAICQAFGYRMGLLLALLFFSQFVDRFMIIGGSFLRYQWMAALGFAIAALKRSRFARAGVALALAAALNVFPVLFALPLLLGGASALARRQPFKPIYGRFFTGALSTGVLCLAIGAAHADGPANYTRFVDAMRVHNAAGRGPGFGVGLKYDFLSASYEEGFNNKKRSRELREDRNIIFVGAALLLLCTLALLPRLDLTSGAILSGFSGLFGIFGPTGYYFAFAPLLLLLWHRKDWDSGASRMLTLTYALSMPPYVYLLAGAHRFYVFNRVVSASWTLYLVATLALLAWQTGLYRAKAKATVPDTRAA